jgi:hypothetical protein
VQAALRRTNRRDIGNVADVALDFTTGAAHGGDGNQRLVLATVLAHRGILTAPETLLSECLLDNAVNSLWKRLLHQQQGMPPLHISQGIAADPGECRVDGDDMPPRIGDHDGFVAGIENRGLDPLRLQVIQALLNHLTLTSIKIEQDKKHQQGRQPRQRKQATDFTPPSPPNPIRVEIHTD